MVRCRCGVWTDYGLSCFRCRLEVDHLPLDYSEEEELDVVEPKEEEVEPKEEEVEPKEEEVEPKEDVVEPKEDDD